MYTSTVTQKGQVTIPIEIRKMLGFEKGSKVQFSQENGKVLVRKASDVSSLMGILKSPKKYDQRKAREAIGKDMAKHYLESIK